MANNDGSFCAAMQRSNSLSPDLQPWDAVLVALTCRVNAYYQQLSNRSLPWVFLASVAMRVEGLGNVIIWEVAALVLLGWAV